MHHLLFAFTWCAITALLLMVAIAGGATPFAFAFAATISALSAIVTLGAGFIARYLGGE
tara:strand:- start:897 stop:1073 length:177 start_codon:yes stop_codon:yes gene_type:complete